MARVATTSYMPRLTTNHAGANAYALSPEHRLAQLAMTGTLGGGFYRDAAREAKAIVAACEAVDPLFLAQVAIHAGRVGRMKDAPALMLAVLSRRDPALFARAFPRVVTSGRMLRGVVAALRSGQAGRRSLGSRPKAMVRDWIGAASDATLLAASVGAAPSLADVIRMVHPKPATAEREAFYAWLIGRPADAERLPAVLRDLLAFRSGATETPPDLPFQLFAHMTLTPPQWATVVRNGSWQMLRQSLNMLARNGIFADAEVTAHVAAVLGEPARIKAARALPHQIFSTLTALDPAVDAVLRDALTTALEHSLSAVPAFAGRVAVCPDVSGSMRWPLTGMRGGGTGETRCVDLAALITAAVLRHNPEASVLPFDESVHPADIRSGDSIAANAAKLAAIGGGGTNCAAPLARLLSQGVVPDLVILVSDNQSWVDHLYDTGRTATLAVWKRIRQRKPGARLVCIDLQPYANTQAPEREDVLNIGGFSEAMFDQIAAFARGETRAGSWVDQIRAVAL